MARSGNPRSAQLLTGRSHLDTASGASRRQGDHRRSVPASLAGAAPFPRGGAAWQGVVIGKDLRYDPHRGTHYFDRANYHDRRGMQNNRIRGITYNDDDVLRWCKTSMRCF